MSIRLQVLLLLLTSLLLPSSHTTTTVLYDGTLKTPPGNQGITYISYTGTNDQFVDTNSTVLSTTLDIKNMAGYFGNPANVSTLDRTAGYTLTLSAQLIDEQHANQNRAGFSVIALSSDKLGIELGFWKDQIWAQEG